MELAPLPSCAQFLNVIESVFSGMARAIIHNSDYESLAACKAAIDRHFAERNASSRRTRRRQAGSSGARRLRPAHSPPRTTARTAITPTLECEASLRCPDVHGGRVRSRNDQLLLEAFFIHVLVFDFTPRSAEVPG